MKPLYAAWLTLLAANICYGQLPYPTRPNFSGKAVVWGRSLEGQTNVPSNALTGVCSVAGHSGLTVALKTNGTIIAWGSNSVIPTAIGAYPFSTITNAAKIGVFSGSLGLLSTDGKLVTMSDGYEGTMLTLSNVVDFGMGLGFRIVLKNDSSVEVFGNNIHGSNKLTIPSAALTNVRAVVAGTSHAGVIDKGGKVIVWGPDWPTGSNPLNVPSEAQTNIVSLSIGWGHALALKNNGSILAWGNNDWGQLTVPQEAQSNNVVGIVADEAHSVALLNDGRVVVWGYGDYGQKIVPAAKRFEAINGYGQAVYAVEASGWLLTTTVNNSLMGSVTSGGYKADNSTQSIQAYPNPGYVFSGWSGDLVGNANPISINMNLSKTAVANFAQDLADNDGDGISNYDEIIVYGSNPSQPDSNNDGITDPQAVGLGYSPGFNFGPLLVFLKTNNTSANSFGLYTTNQIMDLKFGGMVLGKTNNQLSLTYQILESSNLVSWSTNRQETLVISNPPASKMFLRITPKQ